MRSKLKYAHLVTWEGMPPYRGVLRWIDGHRALVATLYSPWSVI